MSDKTYQPFQPADSTPRSSTLSHGNPVVQPAEKDPAVEMIRAKIQNLYIDEPDAKQEIVEAEQHTHPGSKHQQYMSQLNASGKSLADIQAAWHIYYVSLSDAEKYEVWQEFYVQNGNNPTFQQAAAQPQPAVESVRAAVQSPIAEQFAAALAQGQQRHVSGTTPVDHVHQPAHAPHHNATSKAVHHRLTSRHRAIKRTAAARLPHGEKAKAIKKRIVETVKTATANDGAGRLTHKHHLQSIFFGLGCGVVVLFIFLFSFFNQVIIAPFIQPSRSINNTPVIVDTASTTITGGTKVIIPKINLEIPVDYSQTTTSESAIELALDSGVVHYPSTTKPGETGNAAFFGHSSNNIFNPGKYKFAFVLLHELEAGDIFYLNYNNTTYAYRVFDKKIVTPKQVDVLDPIPGKTATATLITCDPPGTSINRLIVVGEQISPDPNTNGQPTTQVASSSSSVASETNLPGNGPSLWTRIVKSIF